MYGIDQTLSSSSSDCYNKQQREETLMLIGFLRQFMATFYPKEGRTSLPDLIKYVKNRTEQARIIVTDVKDAFGSVDNGNIIIKYKSRMKVEKRFFVPPTPPPNPHQTNQ